MSTNQIKEKSNELSRIEYWKKWKFPELIEELKRASELLSEYKGGYSGEFLSAEEFYGALINEIKSIEQGNKTDLTRFYFWFAPTCEWDDFVAEEGEGLGNKIFARVSKWYQIEGKKNKKWKD